MIKENRTGRTKEGSSRAETEELFDYQEGWSYVNLRMPSTMLRELDRHISAQVPKVHRMHWIMKAIVEKMERDRN